MTEHTYKKSGVNIALAEETTDAIKNLVRSTHSERVLRGLGLFSGFFQLDVTGYEQPVLVSSIDGVGTKIKIAEMAQSFASVGRDLVNHCVNDIMVCGADPLFFLDYIAVDVLKPRLVQELLSGMSAACRETGCAIVGGETAEMPGVYQKNNFDVAGAVVGCVEKSRIIDGQAIRSGDLLLGVASNGLHTNGFSLVRKILLNDGRFCLDQQIPELGHSLGEELLSEHKSYYQLIRQVRNLPGIRGIAHITGGGIEGNTSRLLKDGLRLNIDWRAWKRPAIFEFLQRVGDVPEEEMRRTFNLGIGLVIVIDRGALAELEAQIAPLRVSTVVIGEVVSG